MESLHGDTQSACGAVNCISARDTRTHTVNDTLPSHALLRICVHTNTGTADTDKDSLSSDLFCAPTHGCIFFMANNPLLLLWRFPAVAPQLLVSTDDVIGMLVTSEDVLNWLKLKVRFVL